MPRVLGWRLELVAGDWGGVRYFCCARDRCCLIGGWVCFESWNLEIEFEDEGFLIYWNIFGWDWLINFLTLKVIDISDTKIEKIFINSFIEICYIVNKWVNVLMIKVKRIKTESIKCDDKIEKSLLAINKRYNSRNVCKRIQYICSIYIYNDCLFETTYSCFSFLLLFNPCTINFFIMEYSIKHRDFPMGQL